MKLYTIGHGNLELDVFIGILREHNIGWVADVRSAPHSRMFPWFNRRSLSGALKREGIKYLFMGDKLGGKPLGGETEDRWRQGELNYELVSKLSRTDRWIDGIRYLSGVVKAMSGKSEAGCLLCSEKDPNNCHRSAVAFDLEAVIESLSVRHLGHDSDMREARFQKSLFTVSDDRSDYH
jgi:uncharacterized protein (DUF488 family)